MERILLTYLELSYGMSRMGYAPHCARSPTILLGKAVLKGSVLYELGIEPTISRIADILEENSYQLIADSFASRRSLHWALGIRQNSGQEQCAHCYHPDFHTIAYYVNVNNWQ